MADRVSRRPRLMQQPTGIRRCLAMDRFVGEILGVGTTEGTRIVVGNWASSVYGRFADVMVERADGRRILVAPTREVAEYVAATYSFDDVRVVAVAVEHRANQLTVTAGPLDVDVRLGRRTPIGSALHCLPERLTGQSWFCRACDPIARVLMPGVRTHGTAGGGRHEFYGAHDVHAVRSLTASWGRHSLGDLAPVSPAPRFGFGSTPRTPTLTRLTTTVTRTLAVPPPAASPHA